ncbi:MAG TPA: hypothetical protein VGF03_18565, partial [Bryobacteraceae bacterium]
WKSLLKRGNGSDELLNDLLLAIRCGLGQRISVSVTRHPFAGTAQGRPRRLSLSEPAGLETDGVAHEEASLLVAVPVMARNGRWIAGKS